VIGRRTVLALAAACLCAGPVGAESFQDVFRGSRPAPAKTDALGRALADTVARSLPVTSASPGLTFRYDPSSGAFERESDLLGQLYLERATPIGRGKWNFTASWQHVNVDSVQGEDLDGLSDTSPIVDRVEISTRPVTFGPGLVTFDRYDVDLRVDMVTLAATYGVTDDLDVNLTLPILTSRLSVDSLERVFTRDPATGDLIPRRTIRNRTDSTKAGVGDLFLRGKYRLARWGWGELAAGLVLRVPTGSKANFQGTGDWELSPLLYASTRRFPIGGPVAIQGFVNGGVDLNIDDVDRSEGRFGAGIDLSVGERATLSLAFLGREPFYSFTAPGFFDVPRFTGANSTCQFVNQPGSPRNGRLIPGTCQRAPLFGLETARASYYTLSIGGRVNLWRDTVFGFANVLIPLNDQGIHTDPIPLLGLEATF
jgi:hypothetical protein